MSTTPNSERFVRSMQAFARLSEMHGISWGVVAMSTFDGLPRNTIIIV